MATRSLLVKLDQRGWIQLPARRWAPTNRMRARVITPRLWDRQPLATSLAELGPLEVREVSGDVEGREILAAGLAEFHYLLRQEQAPPLWKALKKHAEELQPQLLPKSTLGKAVIYSILISCRRRGLNPQEYLTDVLARLPSMKSTQIQDLLPAHWKPPSGNTSRRSDSGALRG